MSNTIEQRVVEMRFDNSQFEQNVSTTMNTLEKLKQKLNLSGASKGLSDVNAAAKKVDMTGLGNAVETVSAKFSALQVMGVTALANITNSAVNAGKRIVKSLTIDPIKSGFEEYETKMGSIQTILANTEHQGTTLNDVTRALDELNIYADKTIYNFQQMTKNIGTFTAAGIDLDTSVRSIQGIANLAAVSGSTSQQASTAMYQLSQALASGTVKLMDWNSVVNAGMGGKVFQNALIRTAAMLDGSAKDVEAWQKKHVDAYGSFRESLTKEAWLTTEVLTTTLEQFTMAAEEGSDEWNAFKKSLKESGYTDKQADEILKMANTATDAATKVKTFTQLMDTLKESAQSGWAQSWELIVGDFEEAKAFFTELSDLFGGIIGDSADSRNSLLGDALTSNWDKLIDKINEAGVETSKFEESIRKVVGDDKLDTLVERYGSIEKAAQKGAISSDTLKKALNGIGGATEQVATATDKLTRGLWWGRTGEDVVQLQTILQALGHDLGEKGVDGIIGAYTSKAIREFQRANGLLADGIVGPETRAALKEAAKGIDNITDSLDEQNDSLGESIDSWDELVDAIGKTSGRELLLDSVMNVIKAVKRPLSAIGEAWKRTFAITPDQLYNAIEGINKFTGSLVMGGILDATTWKKLTDNIKAAGIESTTFEAKLKETLKNHNVDVDKLIEKYGDLGSAFENGAISIDIVKETLLGFDGITESLLEGGEAADKVRRSFEGVFAILKLIATSVSIPLKLAFKVTTKVLGNFGLTLLDITAKIGDALVKFSDNVDKVIDSVSEFIAGSVSGWIRSFKETEAFKTCAEWFEEGSQRISDALKTVSDYVSKFDLSKVTEGFDKLRTFLFDNAFTNWIRSLKETEAVKSVAKWFEDGAKDISEALNNIRESIANFEFPKFTERFVKLGSFLAGVGEALLNNKIVVSVIDGICSAFDKLKTAILEFKLPKFKLPEFNIDNLIKFSKVFATVEDLGVKGFVGTAGGIFTHYKNLLSYNWTKFLNTHIENLATFYLTTGDKIKAAFKKGKEIANSIKEFLFGTEEVNLPVIMDAITKFLKIVVLIKALSVLNTFTSPLANVTKALDNLAGSLKWDAIAGSFRAMALALGVFTVCMLIIANMDADKAKRSAIILGSLMVVMGAVVAAMGLLASRLDGGLNAAGTAGALLMIVVAISLVVNTLKDVDNLDLRHPAKTIMTLLTVLVTLTVGVRAIAAAGGASFKSVAAILTLVSALKLILSVIDSYDEYNWNGKLEAILRMLTMLGALSLAMKIAASGIKAGSSAAGMAMMILGMVLSLKLLVGAISDFAAVPTKDLIKGGATVTALLTIMTAMAFALGKASGGMKLDKGQRAVNHFVGLATALLAVVAAIWLLGKMDLDTLKQGGLAVGQILLLFTIMLSNVGRACFGLQFGNILALIVGIGAIIAGMAYIIYKLQGIPWQQSLGTAVALGALLVVMAQALKIMANCSAFTGNLYKWVGAMVVLALVIGALGFVLSSMKNVQPANAIANAASLGIVLGAMALAMMTLTKYDVYSGNIYKWVGAMAVLALVIGALGFVLSSMKNIDPASAIANATALSILIVAMAGVVAAINFVRFDWGSFKGILALASVAAVLVPLVWALSQINGTETARQNAISLSVLAVALSVAMVPLAIAGKIAQSGGIIVGTMALAAVASILGLIVFALASIKNAETAHANAVTLANLAVALSLAMVPLSIAGAIAMSGSIVPAVIALAAVAAVLALLVWGLSAITDIETARANAETLTGLAVALTACVAALSVVGLLVPGVIAGVAGLVVIATTLALLVWGLSAIDNIDTARANADTLLLLLNSLTATVMLLSVAGFDAVAGVAALAGLIGVVGMLGALVTAVGALSEMFPQIEDFMDSGIEIFKSLAEGLGEVVSSFMAGLTSELPGVAKDLSDFASSIGGFITLVRDMDDSVTDGAACLAGAIMAFLKADLVAGISGLAGISMTDLADDLNGFAEGITEFVDLVGGIDPDVSASISGLCEGIRAITEASFLDAITSFITGSSDLGTFGESVQSFAVGLASAADSFSELGDDDVANIKRGADAGRALADLAGAVPRQGGWAQDVLGSQELGSFGQSVAAFGKCLVDYSATVSGKNIDSKAIESSATAANHMVEVANNLPASGGAWQNFVGNKSLSDFGSTMIDFGKCLVDYSAAVSGKNIDTTAIESSATAAGKLVEVANKLPSTGGLWTQWITGEQDLAGFGATLNTFGKGVADYAASVSTIDDAAIGNITRSGLAIDELVKVTNKITATGGWGASMFGEADIEGFGDGAISLAKGLAKYAETAKLIDNVAIASITRTGTAIDEIVAIMDKVPDDVGEAKADILKSAAKDLSSVLTTITNASANEYDSTSIGHLKNAVYTLSVMFDGIDVASIPTKMENVKTAVSSAVTIADTLAAFTSYDYSGVSRFKYALSNLSNTNVDEVIAAFSGKSEAMHSAIDSLMDAMLTGLRSGSNKITHYMKDLANNAADGIESKKGDFKTAGESLVTNLKNGLTGKSKDISNAAKDLGADAADGAESKYSDMSAAGTYLGSGLVVGISSKLVAAYNAGYALGAAAAQGVKDGEAAASPSKEGIKAGRWLGEGFIIGINHMNDSVYKAGAGMSKGAVRSISDSISKVSEIVENGVDAQPTIRPVLDLSDVRAGASGISSLFGSGSSVGVMANVGAISSMMGRRGQNGDSEIVDAINKLRKDIGNIGGTSYTVGDITYDDGSNVAGAIKTLVREARMERRR